MKQLFIVGLGPGGLDHLSPAAARALAMCTDVVGYGLYIDLLGELTDGKRIHARALGQEAERARLALELAAAGRRVALVSSGDAGIYAMASLVFELIDRDPDIDSEALDIQVVPGISAMQAAAARVGAPLGHDFCAISLSDLLTPWPTIEKRLRAAAEADFVLALYNPVSRRRDWQLQQAVGILAAHRPADTPVVLARNVTRDDERVQLTTLVELRPGQVDMLTVVLIGNSETRRVGQWVYTPRGYGNRQTDSEKSS